MTANMIKGKGFSGALNYNLEKVANGVAGVLDHSFVQVSERSIMKEIQMVKVMRPNLQKFFYHTSINFPPIEDIPDEKMRQIGQDYLQASGFNQHHFIMFRHRDAAHPHLHILVSRIGFDGKVRSDSNDFAKCEKIMRDLEKKYNLTEVISSKQATERAVTKNEIEMMNRVDDDSQKIKIQIAVKNTLKVDTRLTLSEFVKSLETQGVNVLFNQAKTGYVSGISYGLDGFLITGSKLGNAYKWTTLKNTIDYKQALDGIVIQTTNDRTKSIIHGRRNSESMHSTQSAEVISDKGNGRRRKGITSKRSTGSNKYRTPTFGQQFPKESKGGVLETILHSGPSEGPNGRIGNEYYLDETGVKRTKKKKLRRRL